MSEALSEQPAASDGSLGARVSLHRGCWTWKVIVGVAAFVTILLVVFGATRMQGKNAPSTPLDVLLCFAGFVTLLSAYAWWHRGKAVDVCEQGFVYWCRGIQHYVPWGDVRSVRVYYNSGDECWARYLWVETGSLARLKLGTWLDRFPELVDSIVDGSYYARLTEVRRALARGETVSFGPLTATSEGICRRKRLLPWRDVKAIDVRSKKIFHQKLSPRMYVCMRRDLDPWCSAPTYVIPNVDILETLVAEHTKVAT